MMTDLRIGIDVVDVRDVAHALACFGERYTSRVFTPAEVAYASSAADPEVMARRLGARFAAKEATLKALRASERGISPRSIGVSRDPSGAIALELSGPAFAAAREAGAESLAVSISHESHWAIAIVIARACPKPSMRSRIWWKR